MKYLRLVYQQGTTVGALSESEDDAVGGEALADHETLRQRAHSLAADARRPAPTALTIRVHDGTVSSTDGPFAETREHLGASPSSTPGT